MPPRRAAAKPNKTEAEHTPAFLGRTVVLQSMGIVPVVVPSPRQPCDDLQESPSAHAAPPTGQVVLKHLMSVRYLACFHESLTMLISVILKAINASLLVALGLAQVSTANPIGPSYQCEPDGGFR